MSRPRRSVAHQAGDRLGLGRQRRCMPRLCDPAQRLVIMLRPDLSQIVGQAQADGQHGRRRAGPPGERDGRHRVGRGHRRGRTGHRLERESLISRYREPDAGIRSREIRGVRGFVRPCAEPGVWPVPFVHEGDGAAGQVRLDLRFEDPAQRQVRREPDPAPGQRGVQRIRNRCPPRCVGSQHGGRAARVAVAAPVAHLPRIDGEHRVLRQPLLDRAADERAVVVAGVTRHGVERGQAGD